MMAYVRYLLLLILYLNFIQCESTRFENRLVPVFVENKWGAINNIGQIIIPLEYDWLYFNRIGNGLILVEKDSFKFVINTKNEVVIDKIPYESEVSILRKKVLVIDHSIKDTSYVQVSNSIRVNQEFHDVSMSFLKGVGDRGIVFVDENDRQVIKDTFKLASKFTSTGLSLVVTDNAWGYINQAGKFVWSCEIKLLKEYWDFEKIENVNELQNYEAMFNKLLSNKELIKYYLPHLILDLESKENIDFQFEPYQIGISN